MNVLFCPIPQTWPLFPHVPSTLPLIHPMAVIAAPNLGILPLHRSHLPIQCKSAADVTQIWAQTLPQRMLGCSPSASLHRHPNTPRNPQVMLSRGPVFHGDIGRHTPATTTFNQLAHMLAAAAAAAGTGGAAAEEAPVPPPRPTAAGALGARVEVAKEAHGAAPGGSTAAGAGAGGAAAAVSACYTRGRVDHMSSSTTTTSSSTSGEGGDSGDSGEDTIGSSSGDDSSDGGGRATEACGNHRGDRVGGSMGAGASAAAGPGGSTAGPGGPGAPGGLRVYLAQQPLAGGARRIVMGEATN